IRVIQPEIVWPVGILLLSILVHWVWFTLKIFAYGDWWYIAPQALAHFASASENALWNGGVDFGSRVVETYSFPFYFIRGFLSIFPNSYAIGVFLLYQLPIVVA